MKYSKHFSTLFIGVNGLSPIEELLMALKEIGITYGILELRQACTILLLDDGDEEEKEKKKEETEEGKENEEKNAEEKKEGASHPLRWRKKVNLKRFPHSQLAQVMKAALTRTQWGDIEIGGVPSFGLC
jgi:hypothetical protein